MPPLVIEADEELLNVQATTLRSMIEIHGEVESGHVEEPYVHMVLHDGIKVFMLAEAVAHMEDGRDIFGTNAPEVIAALHGEEEFNPEDMPHVQVRPRGIETLPPNRMNARISGIARVASLAPAPEAQLTSTTVDENGAKMLEAMKRAGIDMPDEVKQALGIVATAMVQQMAHDTAEATGRARELENQNEELNERLTAAEDKVAKAKAKYTAEKNRLARVEETALVWRDAATEDTDRYRAFTNLMAAVNALNPQSLAEL